MRSNSTNRPIRVVVSQRVELVASRNEVRDVLDQRLAEWLWCVGALSFPVPNGFVARDVLIQWLDILAPQAIVLSGGNDIGRCPERDATEEVLLKYAAAAGLPLLGICRGMQMMAHFAGTTLLPIIDHAGTRHMIKFSIGNENTNQEVNSYHDWQISNCPTEYDVLALAKDESIEAIRHKQLPWEGWMWHPEREEPFRDYDIERARNLFLGVSKT